MGSTHEERRGRVFSIEKVADELAAWHLGRSFRMGRAASAADVPAVEPPMLDSCSQKKKKKTVTSWVMGQAYLPRAVDLLRESADYYLVGQARSGTVVTLEKPEAKLSKVKILTPASAWGSGT
ncbi:MAG: DUF4411 family protein [Candidatus Limnocylindrales bacterium]